MKRAKVFVDGVLAGELIELQRGKSYRFVYVEGYEGGAVSLTMPIDRSEYVFDRFPPFFDGVLPEGMMLEGLLKKAKLDRDDLMGQLMTVGGDLVGNVTVEAAE